MKINSYIHAILHVLPVVLCFTIIYFIGFPYIYKVILFVSFLSMYFEVLRLTRALRLSEEFTNSKNEEFVAILKHGLKTPSVAQIRALELLLGGHFGKVTLKQKKFFKLILESERHLCEVINTYILDYAGNK